jgi:uncharacterized membrane protein YgaE (UPF0421/DUF939 family)
MLKTEVIQAYTNYVVAHNEDPESKVADTTYNTMIKVMNKYYNEEKMWDIIEVFCQTVYNKITMAENLKEAFETFS